MSSSTSAESSHAKTVPPGLAALAVAALLAGTGLLSMTEAPSASADTGVTVEAQTPHTSDANLTSPPDGSYNPGSQQSLACSAHGQNVNGSFISNTSNMPGGADSLWSQTSDGHTLANANIAGGIPNIVPAQCDPVATDRATGRTQGTNPGTDGQCTWGAAQKWFEASGSYPALRGDALDWRDSAIAAGWTVVDAAQERSIVVFQPGVAGAGSVGHVAWVDSVSQRPDGRWIHMTEMNNWYLGGVGIFNDRDVKEVPGMSYILLP